MVASGKTLGLLTFATAESGRVYTEADLALAIDMSNRAAVAVENTQLYQALRDADRQKDEFLATLAHELRNPLAPVRNALQILKMPRVDVQTIERSREMMERQVQHLVRLVDDLMDVSRVMRGKIELRKERIELAAIVARAVETVQPLVDAQGHELSVRISSESLLLDADTVREPLLVLNADLRVRRANRSFYRTFKVAPEDTEGRLVYELGNHQWDIPALRQLLEEILPQNTAFDDFEVAHHFESIGRKVMLLNARRVYRQSNHTESILLTIEDITERRRLEDERAALETRFTSLVKNIRDHSIFTLDPQGYITSWNQEAERILRYTEGEVLGQHFSIIFTPEDQEAGVPAQELFIATSEGRAEDERWHMRKYGERFWALGIITPMQDASGGHHGYSKILRDMTDRKRAEEGLQQADRRKDEFLATLAHELRNPLAPIRNGLQLLKLTNDPPTWQHAREMMERQLGQMVRLVDDLLDISRITRNKLELRKAPVELWAVVQSAVETARPQIEANGHTLTVTLPPQPIHLDADLTRLAQVFWNLLNNGAKYTEPGGRIALTAEMKEGEAIVTVQDNGIGIPARFLPNLFEIFSQVDRSLERAQGGLGIGLALVKGLTEAHGGTVEARSEGVGQGCTFIVRLPATERNLPASRSQADATQPAPKGRILIVDDNRDGAASLAMLLTVMGNDTRTAHDGLEGVELAEAFRPELIVLDIGLPRLNGFDACRRIREKAWAKDTMIVAATGWGQEFEPSCQFVNLC